MQSGFPYKLKLYNHIIIKIICKSQFRPPLEPSPWLFAGVGLGTLIIAVSITSYHSVKAAMTNPVDVLKDE